ncbi:MAG: Gfo/Idh/MocA family oxidoreductase [Acidobacteriia bacterium]|nr:Gfo/Idh/MocA family oxidoreductase [Terriglobia bacterium]
MPTRRHFMQLSSSAAALAAQAPKVSANDKIQIATIGAGGMGSGDTRLALQIPGVSLVAVADLYDGRLARAKEVWGNHLFTTRDYREILSRKDIDAVIIGTPDHYHSQISVDAMNAGKDVYCEKPMVQKIEQGYDVVNAQKKTGRILQVGSQYASSLCFLKAKDLLASGAIGELNMVEAWLDRNSAVGAWQYSIPPDASPQTVDWERYTAITRKRAWDAKRFFRWRNYQDYGTGVAGDLYVHLLTGLHVVTGSLGPTRVYSTGGLRFWKDERDVADVTLALVDYPKTERHPEFTFSLRVNFASGGSTESFGIRFVGSEGVMNVSMNSVTISRHPREAQPGYTIGTFPQSVQEAFLKEYRAKYPEQIPTADAMRPDREDVYNAPREHSAHLEHHRNFYAAVRSRKPFFEDAVFGLRTAGPALLCNHSYFERKICEWDPNQLKRTA